MYDELIKQCRDCIDCLCGECKYEHLQKIGNFVPCMNALLGEAADAIDELSKPRWIPVTERLPEKSGHYLANVKCECDGEYMSAWIQVAWFCEKFYWEHLHDSELIEETVTHWMPLPEPPKEE